MAGARGDNLVTRLTTRTWQHKSQITTPVSPPTALAADIFYWYIFIACQVPNMVVAGKYWCVGCEWRCVQYRERRHRLCNGFAWRLSKVGDIFQRFKAKAALPSESFGNADSTHLIIPSLPFVQTLTYFRLGVFGSLGLWHTSDSESFRVKDSSYFKTRSLSGSSTLGTLRLRVFGSLGLWHTSDSESLRV